MKIVYNVQHCKCNCCGVQCIISSRKTRAFSQASMEMLPPRFHKKVHSVSSEPNIDQSVTSPQSPIEFTHQVNQCSQKSICGVSRPPFQIPRNLESPAPYVLLYPQFLIYCLYFLYAGDASTLS